MASKDKDLSAARQKIAELEKALAQEKSSKGQAGRRTSPPKMRRRARRAVQKASLEGGVRAANARLAQARSQTKASGSARRARKADRRDASAEIQRSSEQGASGRGKGRRRTR
ncbi:MAG: hypothetical protein MZV70_19020 [Desulfobacterales bacterium]|nr:hypothetical protein [Desulfobacterales bacterium]